MTDVLHRWIYADAAQLPLVVVTGALVYLAILLYVRITGLRSLAKMTAADFAMTIAVGSVFGATMLSPSPNLLFGLTALGTLFAGQWCFAAARRRFPALTCCLSNEPLLIMSDGTIHDDHLHRANMTRADLFAKLREANAFRYSDVYAVVLESTGDVSVLHHHGGDAKIESDFLEDVIGAVRITRGDPQDDDA